MTRGDSKAALGQQRGQLQRGARGKARIGEDTGSAVGHAAERAKVRRMREIQEEERRAARLRQPLASMIAQIVIGGARLAGTLVTLPFRLAAALRGHAPRELEA